MQNNALLKTKKNNELQQRVFAHSKFYNLAVKGYINTSPISQEKLLMADRTMEI